MGLETATWIEDLVPTNPVVGDPVGEGDDHLRLVKSVLQNQFQSLGAAAVTVTAAQINDVPNKLTAFNGRTATDVVPTAGDYDFFGLGDVDDSALADGDVGRYDAASGDLVMAPSMPFVATFNASAAELGATTSLPTTCRTIQILVDDLGIDNATGVIQLELGSTTYATACQAGGALFQDDVNTFTSTSGPVPLVDFSAGLGVASNDRYSGLVELRKRNGSNDWIVSWNLSADASKAGVACNVVSGAGTVALSGAIDRLRINVTSGAFDNGSAQVFARA